jgi:hypothetical protein
VQSQFWISAVMAKNKDSDFLTGFAIEQVIREVGQVRPGANDVK